jgi:transcriptional regulator with XRE-family HTH domain
VNARYSVRAALKIRRATFYDLLRHQRLPPLLTAGSALRQMREKLGLTMRDVETASEKLARKRGNVGYFVPISRLSDVETKGITPSIYRLYALAIIYHGDFRHMLSLYGVELELEVSDLEVTSPPKSHLSQALSTIELVNLPVRMDPSFDPRKTLNFGRMIEEWGTVPLKYLEQLSKSGFTYGYVGSEDLTMYPLLPPGSFIQVDESKNRVSEGGWNSEYERPIYFVETRDSHICCWCTVTGDNIILQPHPLSPVAPRIQQYPQDAEVIGQVVGVALRLGEWRSTSDFAPGPKERAALN